MMRTCEVCEKPFEGRADAKTCSVACRAKRSRRNLDPLIGSPERKLAQRAGLDKKYTYRQRGQARKELAKLGLVPSYWKGPGNPQFAKASYQEQRTTAPGPAWQQSTDGWWLHEPMLGSTMLQFDTDGEGGTIGVWIPADEDDPRPILDYNPDSGCKCVGLIWIPHVHHVPGDGELLAHVELGKRRYVRYLPRIEHRLGRTLTRREREVLKVALAPKPPDVIAREARRDLATRCLTQWGRNPCSVCGGDHYQYGEESLSFQEWLERFEADVDDDLFVTETVYGFYESLKFNHDPNLTLSVTELTGGEGEEHMLTLATDDQLAEDFERLVGISNELFEIALRARERFPQHEKVSAAVEAFIASAQAA